MSTLHADHTLFMSTYPTKRMCLPNREEVWSYYDLGPPSKATASNADPLIMVPGTCGTADIFFYQMDVLASKGYRVISVQYPPYHSAKEWTIGFELFLDSLKLKKVHLFGASLGAFLVQHYANLYPRRTASIMLCNGFLSTDEFANNAPFLGVLQVMPTMAIKSLIHNSFPEGGMELSVKMVNDWVINTIVEQLDGYDLVARLTINCTHETVRGIKVPQEKITILDVMDKCMIPPELRQELLKEYPNAKYTPLKSGGDFPFLSKHSEFTMHIEIHMRNATNWAPPMQSYGMGPPSTSATAASSATSAAASNTATGAQGSTANAQKLAVAKEKREKWVNPFGDPDSIL